MKEAEEIDAKMEQMFAKYRNLPPEERQKRNEEAERSRAEQKRIELASERACARQGWNAPARHLAAGNKLVSGGEWHEAFVKIHARLKTGFTVALVGNRGCGKTQLGVELMKATTDEVRTARYATAIEFFMAIKATYKKDSDESEFSIIALYRKPKLLVIDEAAKRSETQWENLLLFELLDKRYQDMSDTILIANEAKADFEKSIGPSLASRMVETGGLIECNWPSFRQ